MKNLKSWAFTICIMCSALSFAQWGNGKKIKGNGEVTSITRSIGNYDAVSVAGSMDVNLVEGREGNLKLEGESNLLEYIETSIKNNTLMIKIKEGYSLRTKRPIIITVPYETINMVALAGSGDVRNTGTLNSETFEVALAGSGDIQLKIASESLETKIAGSGDVQLRGSTTDMEVKLAGSGDFDGSGLKSQNTSVSVSGSGTVKVTCDGDFKARVSGSGDVYYYGKPKTKDTKVSGSGTIKSKS